MAKKQIKWGKLDLTYKDTLKDSIRTCLNILTRGGYDKETYSLLEKSILGFSGYVYGNKFNSIDLRVCVIDVLRTATIVYAGGIDSYNTMKKDTINIGLVPEFVTHYRSLRGELTRMVYFEILLETLSVIIGLKILAI